MRSAWATGSIRRGGDNRCCLEIILGIMTPTMHVRNPVVGRFCCQEAEILSCRPGIDHALFGDFLGGKMYSLTLH
ncbi:hypothetical protein [Desulfobulbus propionicus]|jgi:hypothetical protein